MIELRKDFTTKGVNYHQVYKSQDLVAYRCSRLDGSETYYELFKYKTHAPNKFRDDEFEVYPSDEVFGLWAWCCSSQKSVEKVLNKHFNLEAIPLTNAEMAEMLCREGI